jgi:hypothetical protein
MSSLRTIQLPVGTIINGTATTPGIASASVVPILENQILGMAVDTAHNVTITTINSQQVYQVATASLASAYSFIQQIQNFLNSHGNRIFTPVIYVASSPAFVDVFPNTTTAGSPTGLFIDGTNLLLSGINAMKLDDGSGDVFVFTGGVTIFSNTTMGTNPPDPLLAPPGTYTVYYSINGGSSWVTTGLTVAVT